MKSPSVRLVKSTSAGSRQVSLIEIRTTIRTDALLVLEHDGSVSVKLYEGCGTYDGAPRGREEFSRQERELVGKGGRP